MTSIPLILDEPHDCGYFSNRKAQFAYIYPEEILDTELYAQLIEHGFRRSGDHVYRPQCEGCQQCVQTRLAPHAFKASRQQRRVWKKNADIKATICSTEFKQQHFELYQRYQQHRHSEGSMANSNEKDYIKFLSSVWCNSIFVEFSLDNEIIGVAVMDIFNTAASAVYTFFEPSFASRSLGVYAVLWQIEYAKTQQFDWLYLGYWIENCQKMAYKTNYQPLHGLINEQWQCLEKSSV